MLKPEAVWVLRKLMSVAFVLTVAIALAWRIYGKRIAELYTDDVLRSRTISSLALGEPALVAPVDGRSNATWHSTRSSPSHVQCTAATFEAPPSTVNAICDGKK
ncbi:hypothetical protein M885DRAFT_503400, partial [Pelagophyceae sp. CCMP2097]